MPESIKKGDLIWVYWNYRAKPEQFAVAKMGRVLVYVEQYGQLVSFRIDTGRSNDQLGHSWFLTQTEMDESIRAERAEATIKEAGFEIRHHHPPALAVLEVVAAAIAEITEKMK